MTKPPKKPKKPKKLTRFQQIRLARGLSQKDLSDLSGVSINVISKIETGATKNVSLYVRERTKGALQVSDGEFFKPAGADVPPREGESALDDAFKQAVLAGFRDIIVLLKKLPGACMTDTLPTVRDNCGIHRVDAICRHCAHRQQLDLAALMQAGLGDVALVRLPLRCSACGQRGHSVTVSGRSYPTGEMPT
jgi:transcriptional regulator with XRE-family HTH domain